MESGDVIRANKGSMVHRSEHCEISAKKGSAFGRLLTGQSVFFQEITYRGPKKKDRVDSIHSRLCWPNYSHRPEKVWWTHYLSEVFTFSSFALCKIVSRYIHNK